ncbi:hypothetical protein [Pseudomonas putida]|uniref:Uncharacterized protein n=1 Tax=Pseudomonas putida TaxID=303 RepID=A0A8I1EBJ1_PSEPU|nr:hypothetical protein [Pseudomonas putida]MBI6882476.1 hypothetical protein [Pseudomonas putida]
MHAIALFIGLVIESGILLLKAIIVIGLVGLLFVQPVAAILLALALYFARPHARRYFEDKLNRS